MARTGTDLLQPEDDGDVLLGADGDQVVGQQLAGRQELVVPALVDQDVQSRARVRRRQHGGVVRLGEGRKGRSLIGCDRWATVMSEGAGSYLPGGPVGAQVSREGLLSPRTLHGVTDGGEGRHSLQTQPT